MDKQLSEPQSLSEQELRKRIRQIVKSHHFQGRPDTELNDEEIICLEIQVDQLLATLAEDTIKKARNDYVKLDENQTPPRLTRGEDPSLYSYKDGQESMVRAVWRKVKNEKPKNH